MLLASDVLIHFPTPAEVVALNAHVLGRSHPPPLEKEFLGKCSRMLSSIENYTANSPGVTVGYISATLLTRIIKSRIFKNGNKRTAVLASISYLIANCFLPPPEALEEKGALFQLTIKIASNLISDDDVPLEFLPIFEKNHIFDAGLK